MRKLVGGYPAFSFEEWPVELMVELQQLLSQLNKPGTADRIDQVAVRIISESSSVILKNQSRIKIVVN